MDSSNANEAKVFALLIGCKLGGISAIIEGDIFGDSQGIKKAFFS